MKFHHIGLVVKNLSIGLNEINKITKITFKSKLIKDKNLGVNIIFIKTKNSPLVELIAPINKSSPIQNTLKKKTNIINHFAYKSKTFEKDIIKIKKKGFFQITKPTKAKYFNHKKVTFFMSKLNHIIEIIED
tara:strand:+ start:135 stop:530 length:396 start_codon:yes stop_codon:yes gene_type:complete